MSVRLESLEFLPTTTGGWTSGRREFGSFLTFVTGENGAGKTPVMKGIAYALGHALKLTDDVRVHCEAITLELKADDDRLCTLNRMTSEGTFAASAARVGDSEQQHFDSEPELTEWLIALLKIPVRPLAGRERGSIHRRPYASVVTPIFWLDQDRGWVAPYVALQSKNFVRDQGEETVRWMLGVAQRNPAIDRKEQLELEGKLESAESLIRARQAMISELTSELTDAGLDALEEAKRRVLEQLRASSGSLQAMANTGEALAQRYEEFAGMVEQARRRRAALAWDKQKLVSAIGDIEADQEVLLANENAADLFRKVCGNVSCAFFRQPTESYGRRLLFVKDQLKDLGAAVASIERELVHAEVHLAEQERSLVQLGEQRTLAQGVVGVDRLVTEVDALAGQLQSVTLQLVRRQQLVEEERRMATLIERRAKLRDDLDRMTGSRRRTDDRTQRIKVEFEKSVLRWLDTLNTPNIDQVAVNDNFEVTTKGRRFNYDSEESGSTRTRFVLAYHAALLETSMKEGGHHPPWLICDAPRQQEIETKHLVNWVEALRKLATKHPFQLVLSGKDVFATINEKTDKVWRPTFRLKETFLQHLGPSLETTQL